MLCSNPYVKTQVGITRAKAIISEDARTATTPFPCGRCLNCKINKSREWTNRILLENMASADSSFITLTYNEDNIPEDGSLKPNHLRNFIQTYRRKTPYAKTRYFAVGEYDSQTWRPHYHLVMFSDDIIKPDCVESSWRKGFSMCGDVSKDSARYITGYVTKKVTKPYYENLGSRLSEFMRSSKNGGGIGVPAIRILAEKLTNSPYFKPRPIREIRIGNQTLPLGRYLTEKLCDQIGVTEDQKRIELYEYQFEMINKYSDSTNFLGALLDDTYSKRLSKEKRYKIYSKRKSL